MKGRRVAITGIGAITSLGHTRLQFWEELSAGRPGISAIAGIEPGKLRFPNGAQVRGYDPARYFEEKDLMMLDRNAQFGAIAAREAVSDAGIQWTPELRGRSAVITGCSVGGQETEDQQFQELYRCGSGRIHPMTIPRIMGNAAASRISLEFGVTGPVFNISTACASSNHAIGDAFWLVRSGAVDAAIAGGCEAIFSLGFLKAWEALRVVSPDTCRPFSKDRRGMILGEGAAMLVLEPLEAARARGARVYAEIVGFGMSSDAHHITQPQAEGAARAMRGALTDAEVSAPQVEYINAHGTGTPANDSTEVAAIRDVFAAHAGKLAVSSTKSMHGHALGAAGALEAAATAMSLSNGVLPPTANFTEADPACNLDVIPNVARHKKVEYAMSNSFAFGGLNAVLLFRALSCLLAFFLAGPLHTGLLHAGCTDPSLRLQAGYRYMYNLDFPAAHKEFDDWKKTTPSDAMGPVSNAAAYLFAEFERLHILESEFFVDDNTFKNSKKLAPDLMVKRAFEAEIALTHQVAARALAAQPSESGAMLADVLANGLQSDYAALIDKRYLASLDQMKSSRKLAEQLLAAHPDCADAHLAIGVENYILSLKPMVLRWALRLGGAHTDQETGIATLKKTAENGRLLQPFARLLLAVAALRNKDRPGARRLLEGLATEFPHNHLYATELEKLRKTT